MGSFKRVDVLLDEDTNEKFDEDEVVCVTLNAPFGGNRQYIGKIDDIDILEMILDMSEKYKSKTIKIKYEEILKIERINNNAEI